MLGVVGLLLRGGNDVVGLREALPDVFHDGGIVVQRAKGTNVVDAVLHGEFLLAARYGRCPGRSSAPSVAEQKDVTRARACGEGRAQQRASVWRPENAGGDENQSRITFWMLDRLMQFVPLGEATAKEPQEQRGVETDRHEARQEKGRTGSRSRVTSA